MDPDRGSPTPEPADRERRLHAYLLDRTLGWGIALGIGGAVGRTHGPVAGLGAGALVLAAATLALAVLTGSRAVSPGLAAFGLRVVRPVDGAPVGVPPALLRSVLVGLAGLPTGGLGLAALAWTALTDPTGRRRGLHDRICGTIVIDARPSPTRPTATPAPAPALVNLTALRLLPDPPPGAGVHAPTPRAASGMARAVGSWRLVSGTGEVVGLDDRSRVGSVHLHVTPDGALVAMERGGEPASVVRRGHRRPLAAGRPATLVDGDLLLVGECRWRVEGRCGAG